MSRNLLVLFLIVTVMCVAVTSFLVPEPPEEDCDDFTTEPPPTTRPPPPPHKKCGKHEIWKDCGIGIACQPSCKNPRPICPQRLLCIRTCVCKDGLLRNSEGECVQPCDCYRDICDKKQDE